MGRFDLENALHFCNQNRKKILAAITSFVLVAAILNQSIVLGAITAYASYEPLQKPIKDLVIVLADDELMNSDESYQGLNGEFSGLRNTTIKNRVERYANDIRGKLDNTDVHLTTVPRNESPVTVAAILKQAYFANLEQFENRRLIGIVVVGEVPLPVVNKNGNRFVSMYPYTDFEDPLYTYNAQTNFFEYGQTTNSFEPEIWHGVIKVSATDQVTGEPLESQEVGSDYAKFFDKNHLYHEGREEFAEFDQSMFLSEPVHEANGYSDVLYNNYQNYLSFMDEVVNNRYSTKLIPFLEQGFGLEDFDQSRNPVGDYDVSDLPYLQSQPIIQNSMSKFAELYANATSKERLAILGTGRYNESEYLSPLTAITKKDEYMMQYLKLVNQMLEEKIDQIASTLSVDIPIIKGATVGGRVTFNNGEVSAIEPQVFVNNSPHGDYLEDLNEASFTLNPLRLLADFLFDDSPGDMAAKLRDMPMMVNGTRLQNINSADQCRIYRGGGQKTGLDTTVRMTRGPYDTFDEEGNPTTLCYSYTDISRSSNTHAFDADSQFRKRSCNVFFGQSLKDTKRLQEATNIQKGQLTHEACANMRPVSKFRQLMNFYSGGGGDQSNEEKYILADSPTRSSEVNFLVESYGNLPLSEILPNLQDYSGEVDDWNAWSSYLMANPVKTSFVAEGSMGIDGNITKVELNVAPIGKVKDVPSLVTHKDPTPEIVREALSGINPPVLPVDAVRYATFVDSSGNKQEIVYPNIFKATSLAEFRRQLRELEELFNDLSGDTTYNQSLLSLIEGEQNRLTSGGRVMTQASNPSINEFIAWRNYGINQKYSDIYGDFLNYGQGVSMLNMPTSFEVGVITADVKDDGLDMTIFNGEESPLTRFTGTSSSAEEDLSDLFKTQERERANESQSVSGRRAQGIPFLQWFTTYIPQWIDENSNLGAEIIGGFAEVLPGYDDVIGSSASQIASVEVTAPADNLTLQQSDNFYFSISLKDSNGRTVVGKNDFATVKLTGANVVAGTDDDTTKSGTQIFMVDGTQKVEFTKSAAGEVKIDVEIGEAKVSKTIRIHEKLIPKIETTSNSVEAGSSSGVDFSVVLTTEDGTELSTEQPKVYLDGAQFGEISFLRSEGNKFFYNFLPSTNTGNVNLNVNILGDTPTIKQISVTPSTPERLRFKEPKTSVETDADTEYVSELELLDRYGNRTNVNITGVNLLSSSDEKLSLTSNTVNIVNGAAEVRFRVAANANGSAFIVASKSGLAQTIHKVEFSNLLSVSEFAGFKSTVLYQELRLRGTNPMNVAGSMLSNGKVESISTLTTDVAGLKPSLFVHPTGAFENVGGAKITTNLSVGEDNLMIQILDNRGARITGVRINPAGLDNIKIAAPEQGEAGVYIDPQSNSNLTFANKTLSADGSQIVRFNANSVPILLDQSYTLEPFSGTKFYTLRLVQNSQTVAHISYNFESSGAVAIVPNSQNPNYIYKKTNTLSTTRAPLGFAFYNESDKLSQSQLPESPEVRTEDSFTTPYVGFGEGNKSVLLFAAGVAVGEANRPYLSEAGIVVGDPTVSIDPEEDQNLGTYIGRGDAEFTNILERDEDVLFADVDGYISKFDKESKLFQKNLIQIPNGIRELQKFDDDKILILADEACTKEDSCVYLIDPASSDGAIITSVSLDSDSKIKKIITADFNADNSLDLITLSENNNLSIHWNQSGTIRPAGSLIGTTDLSLDQPESFINSVWLTKPAGLPSTAEPRPYSSNIDWNASGGTPTNNTNIYEIAGRELVPVLEYPGLNATVRLSDKNGGELRNGDTIGYTLTITSSSATLSNAELSLPVGANYETINSSLSPSGLTFIETGEPDRPNLISGVNLNPGQTVRINFDAVFKAKKSSEPPIISVVTDERSATPDGIPDLKIITRGADYIVYYHSNYNRSENRIGFTRFIFQEQKTDLSDVNAALGLEEGIGQNLPGEDPDNPSSNADRRRAAERLGEQLFADDDNDGFPNTYDGVVGGINQAASSIEDAISRFSCSGAGCLAVPYNYAFLVPGNTPAGLAMPVFSWGCPPPGFVWPPMPWQGCTGGRIYMSPTLTGELAGAVCIGPFRLGACWVSRIADMGRMCDIINSGIQDLMSAATSMVEDATGGVVSVGGGGSSGSNVSVPGFPKVLTDWLRNQIEEILDKLMDLPDLTIIYPEPQSLLGYFEQTETEEAEQFEEIDYLAIEDVLADISAMPLFSINIEKYTLDYPVTPAPEEFSKYEAQARAIWKENVLEVYNTLNSWACYGRSFKTKTDFEISLTEGTLRTEISNAVGDDPEKQGCITLAATFFELNNAFYLNLETLADYRKLPRDLFEVQNFLADYANQIIGYAEVILDRTAGFLVDNTAALVEWQNLFITIQNLVEEFKIIIDFITNFMVSCDDCRTTRTDGGSIQLLLNLFLSMPPEIPVIEFPKLPNITLDVSQIEAGIDITLPGLDFNPVPIALPDLEMLVIDLPDAPPINLSLDLGKYGLTAFPSFPPAPDIDKFIVDLPDLPDLNIPKLPVMPLPPDLEALGLDFFSQIEVPLDIIGALLRIYCILKKGIIPIPESMLASQIKNMTARPLDVVLPIDMGVGFRWPQISYEYVEEIRFVLETHLNFDLDVLSDAVGNTVERLNALTSRIVVGTNNFLQDTVDTFVPSGTYSIPGSDELENLDLEADFDLQEELDIDGEVDLIEDLSFQIENLNESFGKISAALPKEINLVATTEKFTPEQVKNYKPKYEQAQIPQKLQEKYESLIAYRDSVKSISPRMIASTENVIDNSESVSVKAKTFQIAQASPTSVPSSATTGAQFTPTDGIYSYDAETKRSTKLIAYNAEADKEINLMPGDIEGDGDKDLVYTVGTELFFKENHTRRAASSRGTGRTENTSWSVLTDQLPSSDALLAGKVNMAIQNKEAVLELTSKLTDQTIVVDTYAANTERSVKENRYIYTLGAETDGTWAEKNSERVNGHSVSKDGFNSLFVNGGGNTFRIPLDNKPYQIVTYVLNKDTGRLEVLEGLKAITPNICGDDVSPSIKINGGSTIVVPVLTPVEIDLGQSTDEDSGITEVYLDTNLTTDSDSDGDPTNDKNLIGPVGQQTISKFRLNPYSEVGTYQVKGWVADAAGNTASETITIQVIAPQISIDANTETSISGSVIPAVGGIPVEIIRDRDGVVEVIVEDVTDSNGQFGIDGLEDSDLLYVLDSDGKKLFEINEKTGSVKVMANNANIEVDRSTGRILLKKGNDVATTITKKSNRNLDVKAVTQKLKNTELAKLAGTVVHDLDTQDNFTLQRIPGDNANFPGGLRIQNGDTALANIGTDGQIQILDLNTEVRLERVSNTANYQWFEVYIGGKFAFIVFVGTSAEVVQLVDTDNRVATTTQTPAATQATQPQSNTATTPANNNPFQDVAANNPYLDTILYLQRNGVIEGVTRDGLRYFEGERDITRAEYAKIILKILCIEPRPIAYLAPAVFSDIPFTSGLPWFYDETKETQLQKFFTGYLGEINPENNLPPFKPFNSITRAEAAKVILEALYQTGAIDLSSVQASNPWYAVYMNVASDLTPFIVDPTAAKQNYILTPEEANQPNAVLSREQFAEMAFRVLNIKNCIADNLGSQSSDGSQSQDGSNTNDTDQDDGSNSNGAGNNDSDTRTNPNLPNEAGIYIENIVCSTCPCRYTLVYADDLRPGDKIFAVIRNADGQIIARSEDIIIGNE